MVTIFKEVNRLEGFFRRFISLYRPLITSLNDLLGPHDLSYALWQVIFYLKNNGSSTLVDISNHYNVEKPTITRRVHRLEELKLVEQIPSKDRREKMIQLTAFGEEVYQTCREEITILERSIMKGISIEEQSTTFQTLPKIKGNILNKEGTTNE